MNLLHLLFTGAFCGNKIVEAGEECDCGYDDDECVDKCCYPKQVSELDKIKNDTAKGCNRKYGTQCRYCNTCKQNVIRVSKWQCPDSFPHKCNYAFAVLVKDPAVRVKRANLCPSLIEFNVEPNQTVVSILHAVGGPPNAQRRYQKPTRLDAMRALK